ncbi:MAG: hypothetical protein IJS45_08990 [Clostridia bacterium]|nr:hypothetical protein [Clostridia bacterium]
MKKETMYKILGDIDEKTVKAAENAPVKRSRRSWVIKGIAIAACIGLIIGGGLHFTKTNNMVLASASYPQIEHYPEEDNTEAVYKWLSSISSLRDQPDGYDKGFDSFFASSAEVFLSGTDGKNMLYSPLSLYMALAMSAEITDMNTRRQIIDALAHNDIDSLRSDSKSVWLANYMDDGMAKCILASSLWLNDSVKYKSETVASLSENYYASVFAGDPDSEGYSKLLSEWLSGQMDGLLDEYISNVRFDPQMIVALASTVSYSGKWNDRFDKDKTKPGTFHTSSGDVQCDFMNKKNDRDYFWGKNFSSITMSLENNGEMRLILPDEGISAEKLMSDAECIAYMTSFPNYEFENREYVTVMLSVPKFDVSSELDLKDGLKELGITDLFDPDKANFSPLANDPSGIYLSQAKQNTRVVIDEEGCKAASLTVLQYAGAPEPQGKVDFVLDRPFVFEIISETGLPLFVGIVNNPVAG